MINDQCSIHLSKTTNDPFPPKPGVAKRCQWSSTASLLTFLRFGTPHSLPNTKLIINFSDTIDSRRNAASRRTKLVVRNLCGSKRFGATSLVDAGRPVIASLVPHPRSAKPESPISWWPSIHWRRWIFSILPCQFFFLFYVYAILCFWWFRVI